MQKVNTNQKSNEVPSYSEKVFKPKKTKYCLIVPVVNEGEKITKVVKDLARYANKIDIIISDGSSTDGSLKPTFLKKYGIRCLISGKAGLGYQYRSAFDYALKSKYEGVITMDGNGKDEADAIPGFLSALNQGYDYVQGSRFIRGGQAINTPPDRLFAIRFIFSPILSLGAGKWYTDVTNGHRAYSKKLLLNSRLKLFRNIFTKYEILFYITARARRLGLKSIEIPVTRKYPKGQVPTKIKSVSKIIDVLASAIKAATGYYNP